MLQQYFARENSIRNVKRTRWNGASTLIYDDCFFHVETQLLTGFFFFCFSLAMFFELHDPSAEVWINCLGSNGSRISSAAVSFLVQFWWRLSKCWRCYDQWIDTHSHMLWSFDADEAAGFSSTDLRDWRQDTATPRNSTTGSWGCDRWTRRRSWWSRSAGDSLDSWAKRTQSSLVRAVLKKRRTRQI